jgi:hypothetical protein
MKGSACAGTGVAKSLSRARSSPPLFAAACLLGFAAAWGKAGPAIGTQVFTPIQNAFSDKFKGRQAAFFSESLRRLSNGLANHFSWKSIQHHWWSHH